MPNKSDAVTVSGRFAWLPLEPLLWPTDIIKKKFKCDNVLAVYVASRADLR